MPPDTLWQENPNYLQGSISFDNANTKFDAAIPFDAPPANLTKVYITANPTAWAEPNPL